MRKFTRLLALSWVWIGACVIPVCAAPAMEFDAGKLAEIDVAVEEAIARGDTPGGVIWLEHEGQVYAKAYGNMSVDPEIIPARLDVIYDAASLTKVMATTPAILLLMEVGQIELDAPVYHYLEAFSDEGREGITIRQLLTHTSGLRPGLPRMMEVDGVSRPWEGYETAKILALKEKPRAKPGTQFVYSDVNFILLGIIVEEITGRRLEDIARKMIFEPLGMTDTGYRPAPSLLSRIAPTSWEKGEMLRGVVHDPTCRMASGALGHAGIFTTAEDLARFARFILNKGELNGVRLLEAETVELMTSRQSPDQVEAVRGLGWDIDTGYSQQRGNLFPIGGFGHTGFTGPSLWIDPSSRTVVIFMCNRVHPDEAGSVLALRRQLGTLAAEAISDFDFD